MGHKVNTDVPPRAGNLIPALFSSSINSSIIAGLISLNRLLGRFNSTNRVPSRHLNLPRFGRR